MPLACRHKHGILMLCITALSVAQLTFDLQELLRAAQSITQSAGTMVGDSYESHLHTLNALKDSEPPAAHGRREQIRRSLREPSYVTRRSSWWHCLPGRCYLDCAASEDTAWQWFLHVSAHGATAFIYCTEMTETWRKVGVDFLLDAAPVAIYVVCLAMLLARIERISALIAMRREVYQAQEMQAFAGAVKDAAHRTTCSHIGLPSDLWCNRTLPRLELLKELHCQLSSSSPEQLATSLRDLNGIRCMFEGRLCKLEDAVGDVKVRAPQLQPRVSMLLRSRTLDGLEDGAPSSFSDRLDSMIVEISSQAASTSHGPLQMAGEAPGRESKINLLRLNKLILVVPGGVGRGALVNERRLVELELGHIQYGEQPFAFAEALNFRALCTELPAAELLPATAEPLVPGMEAVPRPPSQGREVARQRWNSQEDSRVEGLPSLYLGSCRQSQQRALTATPFVKPTTPLPPPVRELLPMHDLSETAQLSFERLCLAKRGFLKGRGLEGYQDKIALTEAFRQRKLPVPRTFFSAYGSDFDVRPAIEALTNDGRGYVAKTSSRSMSSVLLRSRSRDLGEASHLCCSRAVFVMDAGIDRLTNLSVSADEIQAVLQEASRRPFTAAEIDPRCGDWGTVQAGHTPGVLVEEGAGDGSGQLIVPSSPVSELLAETGATDWVSPDSIACHLVWSVLYMCSWEIKVRLPTGEKKSEPLGDIFRDGSCLRCKVPLPLQDWPSTVSLLENLLPHTDYVRISFFMKEGWPVLNEVESRLPGTCNGSKVTIDSSPDTAATKREQEGVVLAMLTLARPWPRRGSVEDDALALSVARPKHHAELQEHGNAEAEHLRAKKWLRTLSGTLLAATQRNVSWTRAL
eukprot:s55_g6.t1